MFYIGAYIVLYIMCFYIIKSNFVYSMVEKYDCAKSKWLQNLYVIRELWCPAYSKDCFSGGILSSQRSETTNR